MPGTHCMRMRVIVLGFQGNWILLQYVCILMMSRHQSAMQAVIYRGRDWSLVYAVVRVGCSSTSRKPEQKECIKCNFECKDVFVWKTYLFAVHVRQEAWSTLSLLYRH